MLTAPNYGLTRFPVFRKTWEAFNGWRRPTTCKISILLTFLLFSTASTASAFYDPGTQRWLTRDPLAEEGGLHLYRFCANAPVQVADAQGLSKKVSVNENVIFTMTTYSTLRHRQSRLALEP